MTSPETSAARLSTWAPLRVLTDLAVTVADTWRLARENHEILQRLEIQMADNSALLNDIAAGLRNLGSAIDALVAEDTGETAAAQNVKAAFDDLAAKFTADPSTPDVPPLDGGGTPEPTPSPEPPAEPTPA